MIFVTAAIAALAYVVWNRTRPGADPWAERTRAAVVTIMAGVLAMPFMWWSGVPEVVIVVGAVMLWRARRSAATA